MDVLLADSCYSLLNAGRHMANKIQKDPKVVILVGMEGISGINDWHQIAYGCREFEEFSRVQVARAIIAACT